MNPFGRGCHVDAGTECVRCQGAGRKPGSPGQQRLEILRVQRWTEPGIVGADAPPFDLSPCRLERKPGRDVGVVVQVGDDDLATFAERLAHREAHEPDERGGVQPEGDLGRIRGIDEGGDAGARPGDAFVHVARALVGGAALDLPVQHVIGDGIDHGAWQLRAGRVVEEQEAIVDRERREFRAHRVDRERRLRRGRHGPCPLVASPTIPVTLRRRRKASCRARCVALPSASDVPARDGILPRLPGGYTGGAGDRTSAFMRRYCIDLDCLSLNEFP